MLSELPQEIIEDIVEYLSLRDLQSCLAVNKAWWNVFNSNRLWRRFCSSPSNYFSSQENQLQHPFVQVSDVCEARRQLFHERAMRNNLLRGVYHVAEVNIGEVYCDNIVDHVDEAGVHWLFVSHTKNLNFESRHMLSVWNLSSSPRLHCSIETPLGVTPRKLYSEMKVIKNRLFYILNNLVLVYEFSHHDNRLKFLHKVEHPLRPEVAMALCKGKIFGFFYSEYHVVNTILPSVHIWDEEGLLTFTNCDLSFFSEQLKIKHNCPFPFLCVKSSSQTIAVMYRNIYGEFILSRFDTVTLEFKELKVSVDGGNYVVSGFTISAAEVTIRALTWYIFHADSDFLRPSVLDKSLYPVTCFEVLSGNEGQDIVLVLNCHVYVFDTSLIYCYKIFKVRSDVEKKVALWEPNILVCQLQYEKKNRVEIEVYNYKRGKLLYTLDLSPPLGHGQVLYNFSFVQGFSTPPKIVAVEDPDSRFAHHGKRSKVMVISFL